MFSLQVPFEHWNPSLILEIEYMGGAFISYDSTRSPGNAGQFTTRCSINKIIRFKVTNKLQKTTSLIYLYLFLIYFAT